MPWTRFPREMPERRRVMRKCVYGSPDAVAEEGEDEEETCGVGGEARRAATVREAAVPLWTEHRCIVRKELRSPLGVIVGRMTFSMVVAVRCKCNWRVTNTEPNPILSLVPHCSGQYLYNVTRTQAEIVKISTAVGKVHGTNRTTSKTGASGINDSPFPNVRSPQSSKVQQKSNNSDTV